MCSNTMLGSSCLMDGDGGDNDDTKDCRTFSMIFTCAYEHCGAEVRYCVNCADWWSEKMQGKSRSCYNVNCDSIYCIDCLYYFDMDKDGEAPLCYKCVKIK